MTKLPKQMEPIDVVNDRLSGCTSANEQQGGAVSG
jgi:hypothetical protein